MQAQALRIAWASDPAIAEFRGMAEYAWDFNAPGYGDLAPGDDAAAWLGQIVRSGAKMAGAAVAEPAAEPITAAVPAPEPAQPIEAAIAVEAPPVAVLPPVDAAEPIVDTAASAPSPIQAAAVRRRHGGAVPV